MAHPQKKPRCQGKTSINDNQYQRNVAINEQIERKQRIVIYAPVLGGKSLVMDYVFHMLGF
jgi:hypothetical protein